MTTTSQRLLVLCACISVLTVAAPTPLAARGPAHEVLWIELHKYHYYSSFQTNFTYWRQAPYESVDKGLSGTLAIQEKAYRLQWEEQEIISHGATVWTYLPEMQEVQITTLDAESDMTYPWMRFLRSEQAYRPLWVHNTGRYDVLELVSQDQEDDIIAITLTIEATTKALKRVVLRDRAHVVHTISFTQFTREPSFPAGYFAFDEAAHPEVEVVDLR